MKRAQTNFNSAKKKHELLLLIQLWKLRHYNYAQDLDFLICTHHIMLTELYKNSLTNVLTNKKIDSLFIHVLMN